MMNSHSLTSNFIWRFGERIIAQLVTFVVSIVLARIISPDDYGAIAIILVIINFANVLVNNGFSTALIQKKDADDLDFSSVFYFTLVFSILVYAILYYFAPFISQWYEMPILRSTIRILGIRIIFGAVNSVQHAYVSRKMEFKKFFVSTLGGTILSGVVGLTMAYLGCGIWALVMQYLVNTVTDTIVLCFTIKWRPKILFSFRRLKNLLKYGWKILLSALLGTVYDNIRTIFIGKRYSEEDLAFFSKGKQVPSLVMNNVNTAVTSVCFPALSMLQDDEKSACKMNAQIVSALSAFAAPVLIGVASIAEPLILFLLTDKWMGAVPFLKLWCIYYLLTTIYTTYLQFLKAVGRSGLSLWMEIVDDIIGICFVIVFFSKGPTAILVTTVASRLIALACTMYITKKMFSMSISNQVKAIWKPLIASICMYCIVKILGKLSINYLILMIIQIVIGMFVYCILAKLMHIRELEKVFQILKSKVKIKNNRFYNDGD